YDVSGNITAISKAQRAETNTDAIGITGSAEYRSYAYDNLNQLIRENNATNNKTTTFSYDELGNITSKTEYAYTTGDLGTVNKTILYGYSNDGKQGWKNLLTSVDLNGDGVITANEQITYDEIGNPITYLGNSLAWDGRQLTSYNGISYSYDADGIRASKTVGNTKTEYYYVGGVIHYQVSTNITTGEKVNELYFLYDSYGHLTSIRLITGEFTHSYYVTTNAQGDVLGIYTAGGDLITAYDYDAWGNCTATNYLPEYSLIGEINPIRYRGYYYDVETGLYYCNSRYYDANVGRWISADTIVSGAGSIQGYNVFAYCFNNPVNFDDSTGHWPDWIKNAVKKAANKIKPIVKAVQKELAKRNITYSTGFGTGGSITGYGIQVQGGISIDSEGNFAIQGTISGGFSTAKGWSGIVYNTVTNAPDINYLEGQGYQVGGLYGWNIGYVPVVAGGDVNIIPTPNADETYFGGTFNTGFGSPGFEGHIDWSNTGTLPGSQFNVFNCCRNIYYAIMEW
ncbi:MAG: RHS repeat-associated core domain-containing protein, partial [Clostridia bacterium]|nr:RHS repeat-associated core domain-containing protein [Clostridia bacterium]